MPTIRSVVAVMCLAATVVACSGGGAAASASPPPDADTTITAQGNVFQPAELRLAADTPQKVFFKNLDSVPHNVAIYADQSASQQLFIGEVITNAAVTYNVPAIAAGQYFFRCDVHPEMRGAVVVGG